MRAVSEAREYDLIVIGSGAAGLSAACVAAAHGLRVLLAEKTAFIGGTTALSGGMVWAPNNDKMKAVGLGDSLDAARAYLAQTVPGSTDERCQMFVRRAGEAVAYLETHASLQLRPVTVYPDYYPDRAGATAGGRVLEPVPFDAGMLGRDFPLIRPPLPEFTLLGGMMVGRADIPHFRRFGRSLKSSLRVLGLVASYARQRLSASRGTTLHLGNALVAWLLLGARRLGVEIALETAATKLLMREGRVEGVQLNGPSGNSAVLARRGVVLATGGFPHDQHLRRRYLTSAELPVSPAAPGSTGDGMKLATAIGASVGRCEKTGAFWVPVSRFVRKDGSAAVFPHTITDRAKPGVIAVDRRGARFVNEARSYHEVGLAILGNEHADPAWLVCDSRFLWNYGLGRVRPFTVRLSRYIREGYLHRASTIEALAGKIGVDPSALSRTVTRFNEGARQGRDDEFGRGSDIYQRHLGDYANRPNPCVAPLERAPFYALAIFPAELGSATGLDTDASARVLDAGNRPIPGLYSCGNDMRSVMNGAYPGPGITLGPALTFGYLAALDAAGAQPSRKERAPNPVPAAETSSYSVNSGTPT